MILKHLFSCASFALMRLPLKGQWRAFFAKMGGVKIEGKSFIGSRVHFDTLYPQNISIGKHVHITMGCILLTHYLDTSRNGIRWKYGFIEIGDGTFVGANTIICGKKVRIGNNVIIGAGSVVTKDIPDNEIWAGNPAKFIKKRE